mmetsp:Transcript_11696/g.21308  ORF Transcript_11696/g.21308 Transcript_11696/m.21308 type:complete len:513 (+) Transcript_11696:82-1620(+)
MPMAMIPGVTDGCPAVPKKKESKDPSTPNLKLDVSKSKSGRIRGDQFWLEQSDTRDSWFGMRQAKAPKSASEGRGALLHGTRQEKAEKIKEEYLFKKVPGELVAARAQAMADREKELNARKLVQQRKSRRKDLRIRMDHRRHENHTKEAKLGTTLRRPPKVPKEPVRVSTQPVKKKDWRFYRRGVGGGANLWTDFYHVPVSKLGLVIPPIALKKDQEAIDKVMELLQEEDEQEEWKEAVKQAKIRGVRHRFQVQMERNVRKEDYVFRNAPKSRPQSAAAIRTGAKSGKDVGGRSRPTSAMPLSSSAISSSSAQEKEEKSLKEHRDAFGFAADDDAESPKRTEYKSKTAKGRPASAPATRRMEVIERLAKPKPLVKKFELAKHSGCAELKGMLLCDRALTELLATAKLSGSHTGTVRAQKTATKTVVEAMKPSTAQAALLSSPVNTPAKGDRAAQQQSTTLTEGSGSQVRFVDPEIEEAKREQEKFEKKMNSNKERWEQEGQGLYSNPLSIYE